MPILIQNQDLKTLFSGVAVAAATGLLLGGVMYPNLDADKVEGPQILMGGGGPRSDAPVSHTSVAAYGERVPDYVIGTDALKPPQYQVLAYNERAEPESADTGDATDLMAYEAAEVTPARWEDEAPEASSYPSERGNLVYEADLPAPPAPPAEGEDTAEDHPTGA